MPPPEQRKLRMNFHGRIIDHLGIQMYQSPVAAIAELVANAWDAEAEEITIVLPTDRLTAESEIVISDDGTGMTFTECERRYLNIGYDRREKDPLARTPRKERPVLGRKGIGKFAGFGIAGIICVETVSEQTGEKTVFELDIERLRGEGYVSASGIELDVIEYLGTDEGRKAQHGTTLRLKRLSLERRPSSEQFARSMARRFLLHQRVDDFKVKINGLPLPESEEEGQVEFRFPRDYTFARGPEGLTVDKDGWGIETVGEGRTIKWEFVFYKEPIDDEELRGISVFAKGKIAQSPFLFNLVGGLGGQQGVEYLSGRVQADYLDELSADIIATERQRINWEHKEALPLQDWGQQRVKTLLKIWQERRAEKRLDALERKLAPFSRRLGKLPVYEQKVVKLALKKLAGISRISQPQFEELGDAIMVAWEGGRLKGLINSLASKEDLSEQGLLDILLEVNILTALHIAEAVRTKILLIRKLEELIEKREKELDIRDFIADNPWLLSPEWDTFKKETSVQKLIREVASEVGIDDDDAWKGRIDLVLGSGEKLLIVELMRPGLKIDWDHVGRFERYIQTVRSRLEANTGGRWKKAVGLLIADKLNKDAGLSKKIISMEKEEMLVSEWTVVLGQAEDKWKEFFDVLKTRAPEDPRLMALVADEEGVSLPTTP